MQHHTGAGSAHQMLADAPCHIAVLISFFSKVCRGLDHGLGRRLEITAAAYEPGQMGCYSIDHVGSDRTGSFRAVSCFIVRDLVIPVVREVLFQILLKLCIKIGIFFLVNGDGLVPFAFCLFACRYCL